MVRCRNDAEEIAMFYITHCSEDLSLSIRGEFERCGVSNQPSVMLEVRGAKWHLRTSRAARQSARITVAVPGSLRAPPKSEGATVRKQRLKPPLAPGRHPGDMYLTSPGRPDRRSINAACCAGLLDSTEQAPIVWKVRLRLWKV